MSVTRFRNWRTRIAATLMFLPIAALVGCNVQQATEVLTERTVADSGRAKVNVPDKTNDDRCIWINGEWLCY